MEGKVTAMPNARNNGNKKVTAEVSSIETAPQTASEIAVVQAEITEGRILTVEATIDTERTEAGDLLEEIRARNQKIGAVLRQARQDRNIALSRCAERIGTSWRRYNAIEDGKAQITAVELHMLSDFLGVHSEIQEVLNDGSGTEMHNLGAEVTSASMTETIELIQLILSAAQQKGRDVSIHVVNAGTNGGTYTIRPLRNITPAALQA